MVDAVLHDSSRRVLEFDAVLEALAGQTQSALGAAVVRALEPRAEVASSRLAAVEETRTLAGRRGYVACGQAVPLDEVLERTGVRGVVVDLADLADARRTARVIEAVRRHLPADAETFPELSALAAEVPSLGELVAQLDSILDDDDGLRDDASPELRRIRVAQQTLHRRVRSRLEKMTHEPGLSEALQDTLVTERGGRLVLPVRAGQRDRVPGVVHDSSSSGQTLFVEPLAAVEDQNRLAELRGAERDEIRRLLAEATAHVRAVRAEISTGSDVVASVDALQAISRWANELDAVTPRGVEAGVELRGARHPLLEPEQVVPLDLRLAVDERALVITGPNTGGKTVALKTLGLFVALAQSGVPVPADDAALPGFGRVHADIGDEQSLAASLSTFSGHLRHIAAFLADCPPGSLVLLDELGTGTDPAEGAALAIALVEEFMARGATVIVSTHHDALKVFAQRTPGVVNAAMEFDVETLSPTYRLRIGRPGRSNALDIAQRLGLAADIVARARELMSAGAVELDDVLRELEAQERELAASRSDVETRAGELEAELQRARQQYEESAAEYAAATRAAREAVAETVTELKAEGERRLERLEKEAAAASERTRADRRAGLAAELGDLRRSARQRLDREARRREPEVPAARQRPAPPEPAAGSGAATDPTAPLQRGDPVRVEPFGMRGSVLRDWAAGSRDDVEVDVGGKRLMVSREQVLPDTGARRPSAPGIRPSYGARPDVSAEIDLHGLRVDEALAAVDKHIDRAILAGLHQVRLIHGFGTLRLKNAIREHLRDRPEVASLVAADPFSGGEGVTVVTLED